MEFCFKLRNSLLSNIASSLCSKENSHVWQPTDSLDSRQIIPSLFACIPAGKSPRMKTSLLENPSRTVLTFSPTNKSVVDPPAPVKLSPVSGSNCHPNESWDHSPDPQNNLSTHTHACYITLSRKVQDQFFFRNRFRRVRVRVIACVCKQKKSKKYH